MNNCVEYKQKYLPLFISLSDFMARNGYTKKPFPKIHFMFIPQNGPFAPTANYDPLKKVVNLYCGGRHIKDILRSYAHELIHHKQNMEGRLENGSYSGDKITEDEKLIKLEREAYLNGNIALRSWTETEQKKNRNKR